MTPYDETKQMTCRACGAKGMHHPTYCFCFADWDKCKAVHPTCPEMDTEHLDITCSRCGFVWPMALAEVKA